MSCWCQHARARANPNLNSPAKVSDLLFFLQTPPSPNTFTLLPPFPLISRHLCLRLSILPQCTHPIHAACVCVYIESASLYACCCYTSLSLEIKERSWCVCWERERRSEPEEERGWEVIETEIDREGDRDATGWNEKAVGKEITKGWERWRKCSIAVFSSQPARLYSVSLPLPSVLHTALPLWQR